MPGLYRRVGVETSVSTASPHQLIKLLLDGYFDAITQARGAIQARDIALRSVASGFFFAAVRGLRAEGLALLSGTPSTSG